MDNNMHPSINNHQGNCWPVVDYSLNKSSVSMPPNFENTSGSIILNVAPSQTIQLLPAAAASTSMSSQFIHRQTPINVQQPHQQQISAVVSSVQQNTHHAMLAATPTGSAQVQVGQILPAIIQSHNTGSANMVVSNQQVASNMIWQNTTQPTFSTQQQIHHQVHPPVNNLVTVGVQTATFCDENIVQNQENKVQNITNKLKLPAKKRHGKFLCETTTTTNNKKSKIVKKKDGLQNCSNPKNKGFKQASNSNKVEAKRKRSCNPQAWKKNVRKIMRVQGKGYINTKGVYVPPKTRSGPPCRCRMRCSETIQEEECNEIFNRFLQIGDKDIQDALLYSLITKEQPKHRRNSIRNNASEEANETGDKPSKQNLRNATFFYHVQCRQGIERVCSTAFMSIYGASQKRVRRLQMHKFIDPLNPPKDLRGKHGNQKLVSVMKGKKRLVEDSTNCVNSFVKIMKKQTKSCKKEENRQSERIKPEKQHLFDKETIQQSGISLNTHVTNQQYLQHSNPLDFSIWNNLQQHEQLHDGSGSCVPLENQQPQQIVVPSSSQQQGEPVEMSTLDSSGFLTGFLLGASGENLKSAVAKYTATNTGGGGLNGIEQIDTQACVDVNKAQAVKVVRKSKTNDKLSGVFVKQNDPISVNTLSGSLENFLTETGTRVLQDKDKNKKRKRNPELWKKNIRKNNRAQGMAYVNSKGILIPAKTRSGPPCKCRMKCFLRITEEECDSIFRDFHKISDKNVQDAVLYNLMIHKPVKHKKVVSTAARKAVCEGVTNSQQSDLLELIFNSNKAGSGHATSSETQDKFVRDLVDNTSATNHSSFPSNNSQTPSSQNTDEQMSSVNTILNLSVSSSSQFTIPPSCNTVGPSKAKSHRDRQATFWYYVQQSSGLTRVCSHAFMSIYGATQKRLRRLQKHKVANPIFPPKDMRGKHNSASLVTKNIPTKVQVDLLKADSKKVAEKKCSSADQAVSNQQGDFYARNNDSDAVIMYGTNEMWQPPMI